MNWRDPYGLSALDDPVNKRGFVKNLWIGALYGDYAEDTGWGGAIGEIGVGFIPYVGQAAGARDIAANLPKIYDDPWNGGAWISTGGAVIGVIPGGKIFTKGGKGIVRALTKGGGKAIAKGTGNVIQTGGHVLNPGTVKALNMTSREATDAMHALKKANNIPNNIHADKIYDSGDVVFGGIVDNLKNY